MVAATIMEQKKKRKESKRERMKQNKKEGKMKIQNTEGKKRIEKRVMQILEVTHFKVT